MIFRSSFSAARSAARWWPWSTACLPYAVWIIAVCIIWISRDCRIAVWPIRACMICAVASLIAWISLCVIISSEISACRSSWMVRLITAWISIQSRTYLHKSSAVLAVLIHKAIFVICHYRNTIIIFIFRILLNRLRIAFYSFYDILCRLIYRKWRSVYVCFECRLYIRCNRRWICIVIRTF